jgi:hypothetical protein
MNGLSPMPESLADGRSLLAVDVSPARRKQLGQCFTGLRTGKLLAALAVRHGQRRFVDPAPDTVIFSNQPQNEPVFSP